jgi:DNA mismatch repair protein MutS
MFATHYHELSVLEGSLPGVRNYNISAKRQNGKLVFLRRILPGATDESYGIEVAKLAGVPESVIRLATAHLKELNAQAAAPAVTPLAVPDPGQVTLTDVGEAALIERLRGVDPNGLTPREALELVYELKKEADSH